MNRRALISALRRAVGGRARQAERAAPDPAALQRAQSWGMTPTYHGRNAKRAGQDIRPSQNGVYGPGIYTHDVKDGAAMYGDLTEHLMVTDKLAPVRLFDETIAKLRAQGVPGGEVMSRAVETLRAQGFEGVRDGPVRAVWSPRDVRRTTAAFKDRNSESIMAGVGGGALGLSTIDREFDR